MKRLKGNWNFLCFSLNFAAVKVGFKFWKKENFVEDIQDLCAQGMQIYLYSKS